MQVGHGCGLATLHPRPWHDCVPLYIETHRKTIHGWTLLESYLEPGDILYLTIPATGLEQLWRGDTDQLMVN